MVDFDVVGDPYRSPFSMATETRRFKYHGRAAMTLFGDRKSSTTATTTRPRRQHARARRLSVRYQHMSAFCYAHLDLPASAASTCDRGWLQCGSANHLISICTCRQLAFLALRYFHWRSQAVLVPYIIQLRSIEHHGRPL